MKKLLIVGSGDLGAQIAQIADLTGSYQVIGFVDDWVKRGALKHGFPVLGKIEDAQTLFRDGAFDEISVAIGYRHMKSRSSVIEKFLTGIPLATVIHPQSNIDPNAIVEPGVVVFIGVTIDAYAHIKQNVLLNAGVIVAHDTVIGEHSFVSPGVHFAGFIKVGARCIIGIGSIIIDNIEIVSGTRIGAGATVVKNIEQSGLYIGTPAKLKKVNDSI